MVGLWMKLLITIEKENIINYNKLNIRIIWQKKTLLI